MNEKIIDNANIKTNEELKKQNKEKFISDFNNALAKGIILGLILMGIYLIIKIITR